MSPIFSLALTMGSLACPPVITAPRLGLPSHSTGICLSRPAQQTSGEGGRGGGTLAVGGPEKPDPSTPAIDPAGPASAAPGPDAGILTGRPSMRVSRANAPPVIDGQLDDRAWQSAARITSFVQQRPMEGAPATEQTEVSIAYDNRNLYFAIYAHYSDRGLIRANRADRDQTDSDDTVSVFLDPFLDQQRAYVFSVNGYGVQGDAIMSGGSFGGGGGGGGGGGAGGGGGLGGGGRGGRAQNGQDSSWDALYSSAGRLVEDGWTAEMAIPFKSLRYPAKGRGEAHRWGFQVQRDIESKNESVLWVPVSRDVMGFLRQMGLLDGLTDLSTSRNLEILPTFTAVKAGSLDTTSGTYQNLDSSPQGGLNVKYGVTSNLTTDFTFNPDFSQIESDRPQIEVNQRFPLFFAELRPFFLEGQDIFQILGPVTAVHTRTIIDPRYGAKLSGKLGKTTLGMLFANDEALGNVDDPSDPAFGKSASVFLGRLRYDLYSESYVGIIATDREFMNTHSRLGGFDSQFRIGRNHRFSFKAMSSDRVDAAAQRLSGGFLDVSFRKEGRNLSYGTNHWEIGPDFGTDVGFVRRVDLRQTNSNLGYRWWPEGWIVNWGPRLNYTRIYNFDNILQDVESSLNVGFQFARNINLNASVDRGMERYEGIDFWKTRGSFGGGINASRRISINGSWNAGDQIRYVTDPFLGLGRTLNTSATLRPFSRLQSQVDINTSRLRDPRNSTEVFNVKVYRGLTTYQFTDRLVARNITEYNNLDKTLAVNLLATYRVNAGTVFFVGYDDHYTQGNKINEVFFPTTVYQRTNRAIFTKLQYLFRY